MQKNPLRSCTAGFSYLAREGKLRHIRIGTLEEPGQCPPDIHIFTSSKMPWVNLPTDVPVYEEYYNIPEIWPQPARDRVAVLVAYGSFRC